MPGATPGATSRARALSACSTAPASIRASCWLRAVASTIQSVKGQRPRTSMTTMSSARASEGARQGQAGAAVGQRRRGRSAQRDPRLRQSPAPHEAALEPRRHPRRLACEDVGDFLGGEHVGKLGALHHVAVRLGQAGRRGAVPAALGGIRQLPRHGLLLSHLPPAHQPAWQHGGGGQWGHGMPGFATTCSSGAELGSAVQTAGMSNKRTPP